MCGSSRRTGEADLQDLETKSDALLLENQLCFPLYACAKEVVRQYRKPLEPLGITYT